MTLKPQKIGLVEVIREAVRAKIACIHTAVPGVIQSYDRDRQSATVQLVVRGRRIDQRSGKRTTYVHRPLVNVPVVMEGTPRAGSTVDLEKGDPVLVWFAERDISAWLSSGNADVVPVNPQRHTLNDSFCIPGAFPFSGATRPANATAAGAYVIYGDDIRLGSADAEDFIALAPLVLAELDKINAHMQAFKTVFDTHIHGGVIVGAASTLVPAVPAPAAVTFTEPASTKVRSE